jgi:hypothetical protein
MTPEGDDAEGEYRQRGSDDGEPPENGVPAALSSVGRRRGPASVSLFRSGDPDPSLEPMLDLVPRRADRAQ